MKLLGPLNSMYLSTAAVFCVHFGKLGPFGFLLLQKVLWDLYIE